MGWLDLPALLRGSLALLEVFGIGKVHLEHGESLFRSYVRFGCVFSREGNGWRELEG
jgi:hypothetical protein